MKKFFLLHAFVFAISFCEGQNLVPNGSFEETVACPDLLGQAFNALGWNASWNTPDYFNACADSGIVSVPYNQIGFQYASFGNGYVGLAAIIPVGGNINAREIIGRQLSNPLIPNTKYYVSFKLSLADSSIFACDKVGLSFSTVPFYDDSISTTLINNHSTVYSSAIIYETENWVTISGNFIADSAYDYVMLGNFFTDSNTDFDSSLSHPITFYSFAYYYIDDVCVSSDSLECDLANSIDAIKTKGSLSVYPNPANDFITVQFNTVTAASITLYNSLGQVVYARNTAKPFANYKIDVSGIPQGMYFLQMKNRRETLQQKVLISH